MEIPHPAWLELRGYGHDSEVEVRGVISGPVSDTLAVRFNGYFNRLDGQVRELSDGDSANDLKKYGGRAKIAWEPSDNFRALLAADYSRRDTDGFVNPIREFNPDNNAAFQVLDPSFLGVTASEDNTLVNTNEPVFNDTKGQGVSLTLDYDFGDYTLTSITSGRTWELRQLADRDNSPADLQRQAGSTDQDQIATELRLTSPQGELIDYVVGLFYYDARVTRGLRQSGFRDNQINTVNPDGSIDANPARFRDGFFESSIDVQNIAAFGNVNLHATDRLTFNGGLRVLRESQDWAFVREALPPNFNNLGQADLGPVNDEFSDTDVTGKVGFQYALTDSVNTYLSYSTGYKGAAFAAQNSLRPGQVADQPTDPETTSSIELGLKSLLFDNHLQLNLAVYQTDVEGFQAAAPDLVNGGQIIQNIGEVRLQGIEAEFVLSPNEYVDVTGGIVVTDNEIVSGRTGCYFGQTLAEGCDADGTQDLAGGRIPNAPDVKFNLSGRFEYPVFDGSTAFILANYTWQDDVLFSLNQDPRTVQEDYGIFDLTVGLNLRGDRVQVAAFAKNLFDQQYVGTIATFGANAGANGSLFNVIPRNFDRYFGARITMAY
jgi:iron complex outermembrane receptor protein